MAKEKDNEKMIETIKEEIKVDKKDRYILQEVPTSTALVFNDLKNNKMLSDKDLLLEIINKLERIEKNFFGKS